MGALRVAATRQLPALAAGSSRTYVFLVFSGLAAEPSRRRRARGATGCIVFWL